MMPQATPGECPLCGSDVHRLPGHIRWRCPAAQAYRERVWGEEQARDHQLRRGRERLEELDHVPDPERGQFDPTEVFAP